MCSMTWGRTGGELFKPPSPLGKTHGYQETMILNSWTFAFLRICNSGGRALLRGLNRARGNGPSSLGQLFASRRFATIRARPRPTTPATGNVWSKGGPPPGNVCSKSETPASLSPCSPGLGIERMSKPPAPAPAAQRKVGRKSGPPATSACRSAQGREEE